MIDLALLRILKHRDEFYKCKNRVPKETLDKQTYILLEDYQAYFERFPEHAVIDIPLFIPLFRARHPKLAEEQRAAYEQILMNAREDVPESEQQEIMHSLMELRLGTDLATVLLEYEEGEVENIHAAIERIMEAFKRDAKVQGLDFLRDKIGDLLSEDENDTGYRWRLECLNESMRPLRHGDFGIIAGRPDKGKTTFLASEFTYMAPQIENGRPIVWLNNEGPGKRIITRLYQSALGMPISEMIELHRRGRLEKTYLDYMGVENRMRVFDIHGMDTYAVQRIIEQQEPAIVIYDMIDKVSGFGDAARTDLALEGMYDWARELCVKYDCAGIATSQISQDGDGMMFPTLPMLKDSKTGKQGSCDFQLMIGASNDPGLGRCRYISLPKNKLRREGKPGDPRATVHYQPEIARYSDVPVSTDDPE